MSDIFVIYNPPFPSPVYDGIARLYLRFSNDSICPYIPYKVCKALKVAYDNALPYEKAKAMVDFVVENNDGAKILDSMAKLHGNYSKALDLLFK